MGKKTKGSVKQKHLRGRVFVGGGSPPQTNRAAVPFDFDLFHARHEQLSFRIAPDCKVSLNFDGIATQSAIRKLIGYLELSIADFPADAVVAATPPSEHSS